VPRFLDHGAGTADTGAVAFSAAREERGAEQQAENGYIKTLFRCSKVKHRDLLFDMAGYLNPEHGLRRQLPGLFEDPG
jgi:hypothetical protein